MANKPSVRKSSRQLAKKQMEKERLNGKIATVIGISIEEFKESQLKASQELVQQPQWSKFEADGKTSTEVDEMKDSGIQDSVEQHISILGNIETVECVEKPLQEIQITQPTVDIEKTIVMKITEDKGNTHQLTEKVGDDNVLEETCEKLNSQNFVKREALGMITIFQGKNCFKEQNLPITSENELGYNVYDDVEHNLSILHMSDFEHGQSALHKERVDTQILVNHEAEQTSKKYESSNQLQKLSSKLFIIYDYVFRYLKEFLIRTPGM